MMSESYFLLYIQMTQKQDLEETSALPCSFEILFTIVLK